MADKRADDTPLWLDEPEEHDFPAAGNYLGLLTGPAEVDRLVAALRSAPTVHAAAKDILRSSRLPLLGTDDAHVAHDIAKVRGGKRLSPVLLVRGSLADDRPLTVADGYHRVCASYHLDVNTPVPARIVSL